MLFLLLKTLHVASVAASGLLFSLRGFWMLRPPAGGRPKWARVLPHIIDTLLLAGGISLAFLIHQYPFRDAWLTAKVIALVGYILLGEVALHYGRSKRQKLVAFVAALAVFAYIIGVAVQHSPWSFLLAFYPHL